MPCSTCARLRSGLVQAVRRGQIGTATAIAKKGAGHVAKTIKAPAVTQAIRKR